MNDASPTQTPAPSTAVALPSVMASKPTPVLPGDFDTAVRLARYISASGLAPTGIQTFEAVFTAMQLGAEVGLTPMASLQNIAVVNGRPTIWGDAQLGLVRASGLLIEFKETYEGTPGTDGYTAVCLARRRGDLHDTVNTFSIADAKEAGLWGKTGPWKTNHKRMLKMRARAFTLRDAFTDILKGIYSTEEMQGVDQINVISASNVDALNAEFITVEAKPVSDVNDKIVADIKQDTDKQQDDTSDLAIPDFLKRGGSTSGADQEAVAQLYEKLKGIKKAERPANFLEFGGLDLIEKAGRNPTVDEMFTELGIVLP